MSSARSALPAQGRSRSGKSSQFFYSCVHHSYHKNYSSRVARPHLDTREDRDAPHVKCRWCRRVSSVDDNHIGTVAARMQHDAETKQLQTGTEKGRGVIHTTHVRLATYRTVTVRTVACARTHHGRDRIVVGVDPPLLVLSRPLRFVEPSCEPTCMHDTYPACAFAEAARAPPSTHARTASEAR